jgi:hypothetical protein
MMLLKYIMAYATDGTLAGLKTNHGAARGQRNNLFASRRGARCIANITIANFSW